MTARLLSIFALLFVLQACTNEVLVDKPSAGFQPPSELLVPAPSLPRLDTSKPMPQAEFLEQVAEDTELYRGVANSLTQIQFWGRVHNGWSQAFEEMDGVLEASATSAGGKTETPLSGPPASSP